VGALGPGALATAALHQAVTVDHGVDRADRRQGDVDLEALQLLADLGSAPARMVLLAFAAPTAVSQAGEAAVLVVVPDLLAGLAGELELPAQDRHLLPIQQPGLRVSPMFPE
jgi:hypothetical protein